MICVYLFHSLMQMLMYQFLSENGEKDSVLRQVSNTWLGIVCSTCHSRRGNGIYCSSHFPSVQVEYVIIENFHIEWDKVFRLCGVVSLPKIINITFCILWKRKFDYVSETCFSFIRFWSIGGSVYGEVLQTCERFGTIRRARIAMYVNISWPFELFWVIEIGWT
jgi:hypothetical protein